MIVNKDIEQEQISTYPLLFGLNFRKYAHFGLFFLLGITAYMGQSIDFNNVKKAIYSILSCLAVAIFDEIHQIFIPGRTGSFKDVLIDLIGSSSGIGLILIIMLFCFLIKKVKMNKIQYIIK